MKTLVHSLIWLLIAGCSPRVQSPRGNDGDAGQPPVPIADVAPDTKEGVPEAVSDAEPIDAAVPEDVEAEEETAVPPTLAEQFVAADGAGGMKLCTAMVYALSPDWNMNACANMAEDETGRQARCYRQREPLKKFTEDVCRIVIEESLRLDLDPVLPIAVMERESSIGRVHFDSSTRTYEVQTDVCTLSLTPNRIVKRECLSGQTRCGQTCFDLSSDTRHCGDCSNRCNEGLVCASGACLVDCPSMDQTECNGTCRVLRRYQSCPPRKPDGTEYITWTYGDDARQNRQRVIVVSESENGALDLNTCAAGETGLFQLLPSNYRAGTVVTATGERLSNRTARREAVLDDPILQVRLGCQELARHRDLCPADQHTMWTTWISAYNLGSCDRTLEQWQEYLTKILGHYRDACDGWFRSEDGGTVYVRDLWPECAHIRAILDSA